MERIERSTSPLPRECSTTELHRPVVGRIVDSNGSFERVHSSFALRPRPIRSGAGEGNRTLVISLEGFCSTIELHPLGLNLPGAGSRSLPPVFLARFRLCAYILWWRGKDSNLRRQSRQIYSLLPLTAREPLPTKQAILLRFQGGVKCSTGDCAPRRTLRRTPHPLGWSNQRAGLERSVFVCPRGRLPRARLCAMSGREYDRVAVESQQVELAVLCDNAPAQNTIPRQGERCRPSHTLGRMIGTRSSRSLHGRCRRIPP
jgi:hypothetical protein